MKKQIIISSILFFLLCLTSRASDWDIVKTPLKWERDGIDIILADQLGITEISWPKTLLEYHVDFSASPVEKELLILSDLSLNTQVPFQLTDIVQNNGRLLSATLCFFSDLPSGSKRVFRLKEGSPGKISKLSSGIITKQENGTLTINNGSVRIQIPAPGEHSDLLPPIIRIGDGESWFGTSELPRNIELVKMLVTPVSVGDLFAEYLISYYFEKGRELHVRMRVVAGMEFIIFEEDISGFSEPDMISWKINWDKFSPQYRYCNNRPDENHVFDPKKTGWDNFKWEPITGYPDNPNATYHPDFPREQNNLPDGLLPFNLQPYHNEGFWWRLHTGAFWDNATGKTVGIFIKDFENWIDPEYPVYGSRKNLAVSYYYTGDQFWWSFPLVEGKRSLALAIYPHSKDIDLVNQTPVSNFPYKTLLPVIHVDYLRRWYGWISLNKVKNWVLDYKPGLPVAPHCFSAFIHREPTYGELYSMLEERIVNVAYKTERLISSKLPLEVARPFYHTFYNLAEADLTETEYRKLRAMFLFLNYLNMDEAIMPMKTMLSGHPDFFSDVKGIPGLAAFLFPDHPYAKEMADHFEKAVALNLRFHTRPDVPVWDSRGGRWTENLSCYVFAALRNTTRVSFLLHHYYDNKNRLLQPNISLLGNWLLNAFTAPLDIYGGRRAYPPQGAHHAWDIPPGTLYLMAEELRYYDPLLAEHLLWLAPQDQPTMESTWNDPFEQLIRSKRMNTGGTNPQLTSEKFTGYGYILRSDFGMPGEMYVHLQQIDEGLNARWGQAAKGGNGIIYYYAGGKRYSHNEGLEDVGDVEYGDTERCTNFGVKKKNECYRCIGDYRSVGRNDLTDPLYNFEFAQFASITANNEAAPEYKSRSVLMSGNDYILIFDDLKDNSVEGRFSWFVGEKDSFPYIHQLLPGVDPEYIQDPVTYPGDIQRGMKTLNGRYYDGMGDFLTLVSHRKDVKAELKENVCHVNRKNAFDWIFRSDEKIIYEEEGRQFEGTSGIIRYDEKMKRYESALFVGERLGIPGISARWEEKTGHGGFSIRQDSNGYSGFIQVTAPATLKFSFKEKPGKNYVFYLDGIPVLKKISRKNELTIKIEKGKYSWQWSNKGVIPASPVIKHTFTGESWSNVEWEPVAGAKTYFLQISADGEQAWTDVNGQIFENHYKLTNMTEGEKVHIRVIAKGEGGISKPSGSFPIYPTKDIPHSPEGIRVMKEDNEVNIHWGRILGSNKYNLYMREKGSPGFKLVYSGEGNYQKLMLPDPGMIYEFYVTAVNGNGESQQSVMAYTDPNRIINWHPIPEVIHQRVTESYEQGYPIYDNWIEQDLPVLEYPSDKHQ